MAGVVIVIKEIYALPPEKGVGDSVHYVGTARCSTMTASDGPINWMVDVAADALPIEVNAAIKTAAVDAARVAGIGINLLLDKINIVGGLTAL